MILILMGVWNELWKVKAPSKVLNLCWRALAECLPTKVQLRKRHVPVNVVCPVCNTNEETIFHALVSCPFAVQCWQRVISNTFIDTAASFRDWFSKVFKAYNKDKRSEIVTLCWAVWKAKNELVWQQKKAHAYHVLTSTIQYLEQWKKAQTCVTIAPFLSLNERDGVVS